MFYYLILLYHKFPESSNIDFTTSPLTPPQFIVPIEKRTISVASGIGTSGKTLLTYNIATDGTYLFVLNVDPNLLGHAIGDARVTIQQNNTIIQRVYFNNNGGNYFIGGIQQFATAVCEAGDTITVKAYTGASTMDVGSDADRNNFTVIRIG